MAASGIKRVKKWRHNAMTEGGKGSRAEGGGRRAEGEWQGVTSVDRRQFSDD